MNATRQVPAVCLFLLVSLGARAAVINVHTSFGEDPATEVVVSWRTGSDETGSEVQYGTTPAYGRHVDNGWTDVSDGGLEHHVRLTGLTPGTEYHYRCGSSAGWGKPGTFRTAPGTSNEFMFAALGDPQGAETVIPEHRAWGNWLSAKDPDFWAPLGDIVSRDMRSHWDAFFTTFDSLSSHSVMAPVFGNHDNSSDYGQYHFPDRYQDIFVLPDNGNQNLHDLYYSFEYGDALFVVLAWCGGVSDDCEQVQHDWMESVLSTSTRKWRIAMVHVPYWWPDAYPDRGDYVSLWEQYDVSLVLGGHTHLFEYSKPIMGGQVVDSYADGICYYIAPQLKNERLPKKWQDPSLPGMPISHIAKVHSEENNVWLSPMVRVRSDSLIVETWDQYHDVLWDRLALPAKGGATTVTPRGAGSAAQAGSLPQVSTKGGEPVITLADNHPYRVEVLSLNGSLLAGFSISGHGDHTIPSARALRSQGGVCLIAVSGPEARRAVSAVRF